MSALSIRRFPDPILKRPTRAVARVDGTVSALIDGMIALMRSQPRCVGLAAPQAGSELRVAVIDASSYPKVASSHSLLVLVNPQLVAREGMLLQREGCLSVPDFTGNVRRAARVRLKAWDRSGDPYELWLEGFEAVIAQHEVDHLDGLLFLDRVANLNTDIFLRKTYR